MRLNGRILFLGLSSLIIVSVLAVFWYQREQHTTIFSDAEFILAPIDEVTPRDVLWRPPVALPDVLNSGGNEFEPAFTSDGITMYFVRGNAAHNADIYFSTRTPRGWTRPLPLQEINSEADEMGPDLSPDGVTLYFYSNRAGGLGGYDLWVTHRSDGHWGEPSNLGPLVNSRDNDYGPSLSPDGTALYFASDRPKPETKTTSPAPDGQVTERDFRPTGQLESRDYDLYASSIEDGQCSQSHPVAALNTDSNEGAPAISPAGDFIYFCSDRPGGEGGYDLYRSRLIGSEFQASSNLGRTINSAANELDPALTLGGFGIHFSSNRAREKSSGHQAGRYDLYYAQSREVFSELETYRARIEWRFLVSLILPYVISLLVLLMLLIALHRILKRLEHHQVGLLSRCMIGSLLAHIILLALLGVWGVSSSISGSILPAGGTRVVLYSSFVESDIARQIRGELTEITMETPVESTIRQLLSPDMIEPDVSDVNFTVLPSELAASETKLLEYQLSEAELDPMLDEEREPLQEVRQEEEINPDLPALAERLRSREAVSLVAAAVEEPSASRALDSASPRVEERQDFEVAMNVQRSELTNDTALESLAQVESLSESALVESESLLVDIRRAHIGWNNASDLPLRQVSQVQAERSVEAQERIAVRPGELSKFVIPAPVRISRLVRKEIRLSPAGETGDLSLQSMAQHIAVKTTSVQPESLSEQARQTFPRDANAELPDLRQLPLHQVARQRESGLDIRPALVSFLKSPPPSEIDPDTPIVDYELIPERIDLKTSVRLAELRTDESPAVRPSVPGVIEDANRVAYLNVTDRFPLPDESLSAVAKPEIRSAITLVSPVVMKSDAPPLMEVRSNSDIQVALAPASSRKNPDKGSLVVTDLLDLFVAEAGTLEIDPSRSLPDRQTKRMALNLPLEREELPLAPVELSRAEIRFSERDRKQESQPSFTTPHINSMTRIAEMVPREVERDLDDRSLVTMRLPEADGAAQELSLPIDSREDRAGLNIDGLSVLALPEMELREQETNHERQRLLPNHLLAKDQMRFHDDLIDRIDRKSGNPVFADIPVASLARHHPNSLMDDRLDLSDAGGLTQGVRLPLLDLLRLESSDGLALDIKLPFDKALPPRPYEQRTPEMRDKLVEIMGGSEETEHAVKLALDWLARHQSPDGRWDGDHFDDTCRECEGSAKVQVDIGLTGLSLLCFLAADYTHKNVGEYQDVVDRGITWLLKQQRSDGSLLRNESMYSHGIATIALAEAYGMTGDSDLAGPVQSAIDFIFAARNRGVGGWRYGPGQVGDSSVLGWMVMALKSADRAGLDVPTEAFAVADKWLDLVSQSTPLGQYRYQPDGEVTPAMCAESMFVRQLLQTSSEDPAMQASAAYILENLPDWDEECNIYYWYYATLALFQHQGDAWSQWNERVKDELISHQYQSGLIAGSWDPDGRWAGIGGRIYQTAVCTLILEVYYRYLPTFIQDASTSTRSSIQGHVLDAVTGMPLPGAVLRLDLSEGRDVTVASDETGRYVMLIPEVPDFVAITASRIGYIPEAINVSVDEVKYRTMHKDFRLTPVQSNVVAIEEDPMVHHLGNDEFTGRINSQFQKNSEGTEYHAVFTLSELQMPLANGISEIRMLVRGAQADNEIRINGNVILERMHRSPRDGSYGEFSATFPAAWLTEGKNDLEIRSVFGNVDLDDFEFVNIRIHLKPLR